MFPRYGSHRRALALAAVLLQLAACGTARPKERFDRRAASSTTAGHGAVPATAGGQHAAQPVAGTDAELPRSERCGAAPVLDGDFTREQLRSAAAGCAVWHYCEFEVAASSLKTAVEAYAADPGDESLGAARSAWTLAMLVWSRVELFQFGPLASADVSEGKDTYQGRGLRDRIYSWPSVSACRVEDQVVGGAYMQNFNPVFPSGRGLFALEFLLFAPDAQSACPDGSATQQARAALAEDELARRKAAYAVAVATDIERTAQLLGDAWSPSGGNFQQTFVSASGYPSEQEALNVLAWSLIYVEREVKDWKLGIPAGQTMTARVQTPETPYAQLGTQTMRANLQGFRALMLGCGADGEGLGFDDWLQAAGHAELAQDVASAWQAAQSALAELPPLQSASTQELLAAHGVLRELTNLLKGDLFGAGSPLNLKTPASVEGDTD